MQNKKLQIQLDDFENRYKKFERYIFEIETKKVSLFGLWMKVKHYC